MKTNLVQKVTTVKDLEGLKEITNEIIGELCWRASLSYGDELMLHIGSKIPYAQKSMVVREKGAWILGTRATAWRIESATCTLITSEENAEIAKQKVREIENTKITVFETNYPDLNLAVVFSNGCKLTLLPDTEDFELPYWELFTPDKMLFKVGPDAIWSYQSADLPETDK